MKTINAENMVISKLAYLISQAEGGEYLLIGTGSIASWEISGA